MKLMGIGDVLENNFGSIQLFFLFFPPGVNAGRGARLRCFFPSVLAKCHSGKKTGCLG